MNLMRKRNVWVLLLIAGYFLAGAHADIQSQKKSTEQSVLNGGFEEGVKSWQIPKGASVVQNGAHDGKACLRFDSTSSKWGPCVKQRSVVPKDTFMTASGWIRSEGAGAEIRLIARDASGKYLPGCEVTVGGTKGNHGWVYFEKIFNTGTTELIDIWLRTKGKGTVWFDNLSLTTGQPGGRNYLRNSGFRICATPGYPSWWGVPVEYPIKTKDWETGQYYGVVTNEPSPVPGADVLRVRSNGEIRVFPFVPRKASSLSNGTYTASVYLKAEGDVSVEFSAGIPWAPRAAKKEVKPDSDWKRFQLTSTKCKPYMFFMLKGKGTVWIAAPQLEAGETATPWHPSVFDVGKLAALGGSLKTESARKPEFQCPVTSTAPKIDGKLDDPCWANAFKTRPFMDNKTGKSSKPKTDAYINTDDKNLYVAFKCIEPIKGKPDWKSIPDNSDEMFKSDTVEFFLAPSTKDPEYYHLALHPGGGVFAANGLGGTGWKSGVNVATAPCEGGWIVEFALPLSSLKIKGGDSIWRLNFCRTRVVGDKTTYSCWAGPSGFHKPEHFARMTGLETDARAWKFWSPRLRKSADGTLSFLCCLENMGNIGADITAELTATPPLPSPINREFRMETKRENLKITGIPGNIDPNSTLTLRIRRKGEKDTLSEFSRKVLYLLNPQTDDSVPLSGLAEYSWYPEDADEAHVRIKWTLDEPAEIRITVGDENKPAFTETLSFKGRQTETITVPLEGFATGRYPLCASATVNGKEIAVTGDFVVKRKSSAKAVRLNRFLRCFEVDGKPYFPIVFHPKDRSLLVDWQLEKLSKMGFNCLVPITPPRVKENRIEAMRTLLDRCVKHDFKTIYWGGISIGKPNNPTPMNQVYTKLVKLVKAFRDHPAGLAWYILDEPSAHSWEEKYKYKETDLKRLYDATVSADPSLPVTINYNASGGYDPGRILYGGYGAQDFNALDVYPWYPDERLDPLDYFAKYAKSFNDSLEPMGRLTMFWLQTWGVFDAYREPTPDEWQNNVYVCLIHGTRGLMYFMCQPTSVPLWKRMGEVHKQIRALEPVLFNPDLETIRGICNNSVHYAVWITPGEIHVMVANVAERPVEFSLDLAQITGKQIGDGEILFEKDDLSSKNGQLVETLGPGQSRVYRFDIKKSWFSWLW